MSPQDSCLKIQSLKNPILPAPAADPWILRHEGIWFSLQAVETTLQLRAASALGELGNTEPITIWTAPQSGPYSRNLWAPEMHRLDDRWFIYLAADDGENANHRMWVLSAETNNPFGLWEPCGMLETEGWAIDGTVLEKEGRRYFVWSGWPGHANEQQNLYISEMRNPWRLMGSRIPLTEPTEPWERVALPLCEGPQILRKGSRTFVIYSASGSWTPDYCLGLLSNDDGKLLDPRSWRKRGPVFSRTDRVWGVGHCCFAQQPGVGDLIFYHAKTQRTHGWNDRNVRVQPFGWTLDGFPDFGTPVPV